MVRNPTDTEVVWTIALAVQDIADLGRPTLARPVRSVRYPTAGCATSDPRDSRSMTLEELVVAVHRHRQQMALLASEWAGVIDDDATRPLVGLLVASDRELGHWCRQLSQHIGPLEQPTDQRASHRAGRTKQWT